MKKSTLKKKGKKQCFSILHIYYMDHRGELINIHKLIYSLFCKEKNPVQNCFAKSFTDLVLAMFYVKHKTNF